MYFSSLFLLTHLSVLTCWLCENRQQARCGPSASVRVPAPACKAGLSPPSWPGPGKSWLTSAFCVWVPLLADFLMNHERGMGKSMYVGSRSLWIESVSKSSPRILLFHSPIPQPHSPAFPKEFISSFVAFAMLYFSLLKTLLYWSMVG